LNYVKGYRYQLYCTARAMTTPHCVVYCGVPVDMARQWNATRSEGYPAEQFEALVMRFEEPDAMRRWDAPLFVVLPDDPQPPLEAIWAAVMERKPPPPHASTLSKPAQQDDYLYTLDKATQEVVETLLRAQREGLQGAEVYIPKTQVKVQVPLNGVTVVELKRLKRQFTQVNKLHAIERTDRITQAFAEYLNNELNRS